MKWRDIKEYSETSRRWAHVLAILALMVGICVALVLKPTAPSILEESEGQQEQECTQERTAPGDNPQSNTAPVYEVYKWRCEPENDPTYKQNRVNDPPRTATDADLLAQERVAYWTAWIGGFTALGLIALFFTLRETRAMTIATREIGEKQVRAYIVPAHLSITMKMAYPNDHSSIFGEIEFGWLNCGNSPAFDVEVRVTVVEHRDSKEINQFLFKYRQQASTAATALSGNTVGSGFGEIPPSMLSSWINNKINIIVHSSVTFRDVFGNSFKAESCQVVIFKKHNGLEKHIVFDTSIYPHHNSYTHENGEEL